MFATEQTNELNESTETTVTRVLGGDRRETEPLPNMRGGRRGRTADTVEIQLSQMVSNIVGLFTISLFENIKSGLSQTDLMDIAPEWDYYNL